MGAAAPVIGLGLQAVGTFSGGGGGTQYQPDTKAKYQADLYALSQAEQNAAKQEALLQQQVAAADDLAKYQLEQQVLTQDKEREYYRQQIQAQYESAQYQQQLQTLQTEVQDYANKASNSLAQQAVNLEYADTVQKIGINELENQTALQNNRAGRQLQATNLDTQSELADSARRMQGRNIDLADLDILAQQSGINLKRTGLLNEEQKLKLQESVQRQGLDTSEGGANIQKGQAISQADLGRGQQMGELFRSLVGNEKDYKSFVGKLAAKGIVEGGSNTLFDLQNNPEIYSQMQQLQAQYGNQVGTANLENQMALGQVKAGRENLNAQGILNRNDLGMQSMGLDQEASALARSKQKNNLERQTLELDSLKGKLDKQASMMGMALEDTNDIFSRQLLPSVTNQNALINAQNQQQMGTTQNQIQGYQQNMGTELTRNQLNTQNQANMASAESAYKGVESDWARQKQSSQAAYSSQLGTNQQQLAAALANLSANQYGVLSQLGAGLSSPSPASGGGGGMNWQGLSGLISSAANVFGGMGGSGQQKTYAPSYMSTQSPAPATYAGYKTPTASSTGGSGGY